MMNKEAKEPVKPRLSNRESNIELEKVEKQFEESEMNTTAHQMANLTLDERSHVPLQENDPQTKLSKKQLADMGYIIVKPKKRLGTSQKPEPKWQKEREHAWQLVKAILEHKESPGEVIEMWTHPFKGDSYDFWELPTNKPVLIPRHLANDVAASNYIQYKMEEDKKNVVNEDGETVYIGKKVTTSRKSRLSAQPYVDSFKEVIF
jgi:hypothetical protein